MKTVLRSVQTFFPFLQDLRFLLKSYAISLTGNPVEKDFEAIKYFKPQENDVFIDVGANRGHAILSMLIFSKLRNQIVAFEPNPLVYDITRKSYFVKKSPRVTIHNFGLGDQNQELTLFVPFYRKWMFDGLSSFSYNEAKNWLKNRLWRFRADKLTIREIRCEVRKLDDFDLQPYFIKIDVQGFELQVLKGAHQTIEKYRPIILVESISEPIVDFLKAFGYDFFSYDSGSFTPGYGSLNTYCLTKPALKALSKDIKKGHLDPAT